MTTDTIPKDANPTPSTIADKVVTMVLITLFGGLAMLGIFFGFAVASPAPLILSLGPMALIYLLVFKKIGRSDSKQAINQCSRNRDTSYDHISNSPNYSHLSSNLWHRGALNPPQEKYPQ